MSSASRPPMTMKKTTDHMYIRPIRLWSTVVSQERSPCGSSRVVAVVRGVTATMKCGGETSAIVGDSPCSYCNDLMYSITPRISRSRSRPWKVGMIGSKPLTTTACGYRIDSRM